MGRIEQLFSNLDCQIPDYVSDEERARIEAIPKDHFQRRVGMYVGADDFATVRYWIDGFDLANSLAFPNEISDFKGFREWIILKYEGPCNVPWHSLILEKFGGGQDATTRFFELFWQFRNDVDSRGLKSILKDHSDYEMKRYGGITSSKYFTEGWHKSDG